jgi:hypothetical protein
MPLEKITAEYEEKKMIVISILITSEEEAKAC